MVKKLSHSVIKYLKLKFFKAISKARFFVLKTREVSTNFRASRCIIPETDFNEFFRKLPKI